MGGVNVVYKSLIPVLTSNEDQGYKLTCDMSLYSGSLYQLFDGNCIIQNWTENYGGTLVVFPSGKNPTITIECPKAITVHGVMQIGPDYKIYGVRAGGMGSFSYSDNGSSWTTISDVSKLERNWVATKGNNTSVSDWIKKEAQGFGTHRYWRMHINRAEEFLGLNQIIFY